MTQSHSKIRVQNMSHPGDSITDGNCGGIADIGSCIGGLQGCPTASRNGGGSVRCATTLSEAAFQATLASFAVHMTAADAHTMHEVPAAVQMTAADAHTVHEGAVRQHVDRVISSSSTVIGQCALMSAARSRLDGVKSVRNDARRKGSLLSQLHKYLKKLAPEQRRELISQHFTQEQRLALEKWILQQSSVTPSLKGSCTARPSSVNLRHTQNVAGRGVDMVGRQDGGYRISLALDCNLYVQSALCKSPHEAACALDVLLGLQAQCRCALRKAYPLEACLASSVAELRKQRVGTGVWGAEGLRFRAQVSFGRGQRLSSPLRFDPVEACDDWHRLAGAWGCSKRESADYSPQAAQRQWAYSCRAWRDIWLRSGRPAGALQRSLAIKGAALRSCWSKADARSRRLQAVAASRIASILAVWPVRHPADNANMKCCGHSRPQRLRKSPALGGTLATGNVSAARKRKAIGSW